ncbi:MAG: hypothetical protein U0V70_18865 [Terriglobia bacterium]
MNLSIHACCWLIVLPLASLCWGQPTTGPVKVSYCDLVTNPEHFAGKMIEVRATIVGYKAPSIEMPAFLPQELCSAYLNIALERPENIEPRPSFELEKDSSYQKYREALQKPTRIEATLEGRFDLAYVWKDRKRIRVAEGSGFGRKHSADARLVLKRMSDVKTWQMPRR